MSKLCCSCMVSFFLHAVAQLFSSYRKRLIGSSLSVFSFFGLHSSSGIQTPCIAQKVETPKKKLLDEALANWERYQQFANTLQGRVVIEHNDFNSSRGYPICIKAKMELKQNVRCAMYLSESLREKRKPGAIEKKEEYAAYVSNPRFQFELKRRDRQAAWSISRLKRLIAVCLKTLLGMELTTGPWRNSISKDLG